MTDLTKLDPETRCVALVGEYFRRWSLMEMELNAALAAGMGIDETRRSILSVNIQFSEKIYVLRTLVNTSNLAAGEQERVQGVLSKIGNYPHRNMMAHATFRPDEEGKGVLFSLVKARGKFSLLEETWSAEMFKEECETVDTFAGELAKLKAAFSLPTSHFTLDKLDWQHGGIIYQNYRRMMSPNLMESVDRSSLLYQCWQRPQRRQHPKPVLESVPAASRQIPKQLFSPIKAAHRRHRPSVLVIDASPQPLNMARKGATRIMIGRMKVYCDTDTLPENIKKNLRKKDDPKSKRELAAIVRLIEWGVPLYRSNILDHEVANTSDEGQRNRLIVERDALVRVARNENLLRIDSMVDERTCLNWPVFSDVQDEGICAKLKDRGLKKADAKHLTQAISNGCDVFLTRDENTIINPHRVWIEEHFPIKVMLPSELVLHDVRQSSQCCHVRDMSG